jgi:hypothetical protein
MRERNDIKGRAARLAGALAFSLGVPFLLVPCAALAAQSAQDPAISLRGQIDWSSHQAAIGLSLDGRSAALSLPAARSQAEAIIQKRMPALLREALFPILVDSRNSIGDAVSSGLLPAESLTALAEAAVQERSRFSDDFSAFSADYRISLISAAAPLVRHSRAAQPERPLAYAPTRAYSGIVIFAQGPLPVHGESVSSSLRPCLFPKVWDDAMTLVLERNMVEPEAIASWGMVGYADEEPLPERDARVGGLPLRIMARAVFGSKRTDVVISGEDALKILTLDANRALLAQGRVVIVLDNASQEIVGQGGMTR